MTLVDIHGPAESHTILSNGTEHPKPQLELLSASYFVLYQDGVTFVPTVLNSFPNHLYSISLGRLPWPLLLASAPFCSPMPACAWLFHCTLHFALWVIINSLNHSFSLHCMVSLAQPLGTEWEHYQYLLKEYSASSTLTWLFCEMHYYFMFH